MKILAYRYKKMNLKRYSSISVTCSTTNHSTQTKSIGQLFKYIDQVATKMRFNPQLLS